MSVFSGFAKWKNNTNHVNLVLHATRIVQTLVIFPIYFVKESKTYLRVIQFSGRREFRFPTHRCRSDLQIATSTAN